MTRPTYDQVEDAMATFEVTAAGFDASTDATDERVYWVNAPNRETVEQVIKDTGARFHDQVECHDDDPDVDFHLPRQSIAFSEALLTWAGYERNKNRGVW